MTVSIRIGKESGRVFVTAPYNTRFVARARELNGKWVGDTREWRFDPRDEQRVRDLCVELFGTDGQRSASLVTLRVELGSWDGPEIALGGRVLARRSGRDCRVRLGDGVVVLEGGFPSSGGSVKNPRVDADAGTVLEARDFPEALARSEVVLAHAARCGGSFEVVGQPYLPAAVAAAPADGAEQFDPNL